MKPVTSTTGAVAGDSFPSMHVSTTFAVGTVLAESGGDNYRWLRRGIGYGLRRCHRLCTPG